MIAFLAFATILGCDSDDNVEETLATAGAPTNLELAFNITQDNTGTVTISPTAEGATVFVVDYGDGSALSESLVAGESTTHVYAEGVYDVSVTATNLTGETATYSRQLTVSFLAPTDLMIATSLDPTNNFTVIATATADLETNFEITFGEDPALAPVSFMEGDEVSYTYAATGTYDITVTAFSGGAATATETIQITIVDPLLLPVDFESTTLNYSFIDFGGAVSSVIPNSDTSGINTSATVAEFVKTPGAEVFAGTVLTLDNPIDFTQFQKIRFKAWSPIAGATVKLKLENATDASIATEVDAVINAANEWETLLYDFSAADLTQDYSKVIVFFDFGNNGGGDTFYWDDVELTDQAPELLTLPLTFESPVLDYSMLDFGGAFTSTVSNPDQTGANSSNTVRSFLKTGGAQTFAGGFIELDEPIDFSTNSMLSMQSYSPLPAGTVVKLKLENLADGNIATEVDAVTTVSNQWEELTFDFAGINNANAYQRVVVFFDFGNIGNGDEFFFDNIQLAGMGTAAPIQLPVTFEDSNVAYSFTGFGGGTSSVITNPDQSGINTSSMVAEFVRDPGAQTFAGSFFDLGSPIDYSNGTTIRIKTWSPMAGTTVRLKVEDPANGANFIELDATTTVANQWEELTWDLSAASAETTHQRVVIFFDFGNAGTGSAVSYYYDDILQSN